MVVVTEPVALKETISGHADVISNEEAVGMLSPSPPFPQSLTIPIMYLHAVLAHLIEFHSPGTRGTEILTVTPTEAMPQGWYLHGLNLPRILFI